jgi:hypothetical protein
MLYPGLLSGGGDALLLPRIEMKGKEKSFLDIGYIFQ